MSEPSTPVKIVKKLHVNKVKKPRVKKVKKLRPKIDRDIEREKVWKLLLENIDSEGIDDSTEAKWLEEESNVFRGRAEAFIAKMRLVQGDRKFSRWKGSVVDSVVGVYLTHAVADHSSSNAFMKLASEYPVPLETCTSCLDVQKDTKKTPGPDSRKKLEKGKKQKKEAFDWDSLRREAQVKEGKREKPTDTADWEAVRTAAVCDIVEIIKSRGLDKKLAGYIHEFLDRLVREGGGVDLEWLREVEPGKVKEYLLSFNGLGLKSVECLRLLTLHHRAFPVDTNVGRIAVRLGWVPLKPLSESLPLHLQNTYPSNDSIQNYLWPRLCKLDKKTLYELHYQMITFGKVFCNQIKPNCKACPMRGQCRYFASSRLSLPGTDKGVGTPDKKTWPLHLPERLHRKQGSEVVKHSGPEGNVKCSELVIEEPASPEPESAQVSIADIEDAFSEGISQSRTEHYVYELPDQHSLLAEIDKRDPDDPCSYLLAIWAPGETPDYQENGTKKRDHREATSQTVRGTILIPCRTAMRGNFPLNGTYFQVNEVFADHASTLKPIHVPRCLLSNLTRKTVYFGTSIPSIFKGLPTDKIQECFREGYVCVRCFDRKTRAPKHLTARLHSRKSK